MHTTFVTETESRGFNITFLIAKHCNMTYDVHARRPFWLAPSSVSSTSHILELRFLAEDMAPLQDYRSVISHVTCHKSHVTYHMSQVTCHISHVTCHKSHVTCHISHVTCHMSHVTCRMSHVTCHMSHICHSSYVICPMSYVTCHM